MEWGLDSSTPTLYYILQCWTPVHRCCVKYDTSPQKEQLHHSIIPRVHLLSIIISYRHFFFTLSKHLLKLFYITIFRKSKMDVLPLINLKKLKKYFPHSPFKPLTLKLIPKKLSSLFFISQTCYSFPFLYNQISLPFEQ